MRLGGLCVVLLACSGDPSETPDPASDPGPTPAPIEVSTTTGTVVGVAGADHVGFMGIPYAAPPVGDGRFAAPAPHAAWAEPLQLSTLPPTRCPQTLPFLGASTDEDCLFLNVHVPDPVPHDAPVLVWIHGGGFVLGEGVQTNLGTRGDKLAAAEGVVVVSLNYRLGQLGFLAHPALGDGNWGFLDQVAALSWVHDNIAAFGGDPEAVTLAGQSAGAMSVCSHITAPASRGLFKQAIVMSGPCGFGLPLDEARDQGLRFAEALPTPCTTADCLRAAPVEDVLGTLAGSEDFLTVTEDQGIWGPVIDGDVLPMPFAEALAAGDADGLPVLAGYTANEGRVFAALSDLEVAPEAYEPTLTALASDSGVAAESLLAAYPLGDEDPTARYFDALGDLYITCPARDAAHALAARTTTQLYWFTYPDASFQLPTAIDLGAYHSGEIQYLFGYPATLGQLDHTDDDDIALYEVVRSAFGSFVRDGVASTPGAEWPPVSTVADPHVAFDREVSAASGAAEERCRVWEGVLGG